MDCFKKDFIPKNKEVFTNTKKILVYDENLNMVSGCGPLIHDDIGNCLFTMLYLNDLLKKDFPNLSFYYCDNTNKLIDELDKYDIIFINKPYKIPDVLNNIIHNLKKDKNKRLYLFNIKCSFYDNIKALIEYIIIDYPSFDKKELLTSFITLANRQDFLEYKKEYAKTHEVDFLYSDFPSIEEHDEFIKNYNKNKNNAINETSINETLKEIKDLLLRIKDDTWQCRFK